METFGRYELLRRLANGGMGQIDLARQKGPVGFQKLLVVKRILPHLSEDEEFLKMFLDEARIAALLNHPNIAQIYESGQADDIYYMAMEYVQGEPITQVVRKAEAQGRPMPVPLLIRIIADAAAALDYVHHAKSPSGRPLGLIHRDVSPQNVMVSFHGTVKLIDFGVAKAANKLSMTSVGAIKGKYAYMSPEQATDQELDGRSDIFGLATILYEQLTGTRLFKRETDHGTLKAVVGHRVPPPSSVVDGIPPGLDEVVLQGLAKHRDDRFERAADFQLALEEVLMHARLPGSPGHLAAFMRELYEQEIEEDRFSSEPTVIFYAPDELRQKDDPSRSGRRPAAPRNEGSGASHSPSRERSASGSGTSRPRTPRPPRRGDS
ncbi:MAG TPA: serine/threonine-protein kinase [Myxococcaceae bacterium]|nr:serine/threonine-protein kinase [Myxococcaceae bacterium]